MREIRLFSTRAEMFADYEKYPIYPSDTPKLRGKFITLTNDNGYCTHWYCEEDHDIRQAISGLEASHMFFCHTLHRETIEWALTRLRYPSRPCSECGLKGIHKCLVRSLTNE